MNEDFSVEQAGFVIRVNKALRVFVQHSGKQHSVEPYWVTGLPKEFDRAYFDRCKVAISRAQGTFRVTFSPQPLASRKRPSPSLIEELTQAVQQGRYAFVLSTGVGHPHQPGWSSAEQGYMHLCMGMAYINTGRPTEAVSHFHQVIERAAHAEHEVLTTAYASLCTAYATTQPAKAEEYARLAIAMGPPELQMSEIYLALACVFHKTKPQRAISLAQQVLDTADLPEVFKYLAHLNLSASFVAKKQYSTAYNHAKEAAAGLTDRNKAAALANLAAACLGNGHFKEAVEHADEAVQEDDTCTEAYKNLAAGLAVLAQKSRHYMTRFLQVKQHIQSNSTAFGTLSARVSRLEKSSVASVLEYFSTMYS